jgi:ergothioneine biosynthesis protein EgtB
MNIRENVLNPATPSHHAENPLAKRYRQVRERTLELASPLSEEDCCVQSMPDASPVKWHLAHTTWFFETFVLERFEKSFEPFHSAFRVLFNSYYNGVGDKHPRPQRGMLTRPPLSLVRAYRANVDERMARLFASEGANAEFHALVELGINHEEQHEELILTDLKHLLSLNPLRPAYRETAPSTPRHAAPPLTWHAYAGGLIEIGATQSADRTFCFDNELPRHRTFVGAFHLASRLATNAEYLSFIEAGGYENAALWLSEGWDWVRVNGIRHPIYWSRHDEGWREFTLLGEKALDPELPVSHLCYFEADAFARWSGARLPTEFEWECASKQVPIDGNFLDDAMFHPRAAPAAPLSQLFGDLWEWTSSSYAAYPGFRAPEGAIGEYNGKFMVNQYVLRGGSCATPLAHIRASYRNFFPTAARWQFTGVRLARD